MSNVMLLSPHCDDVPLSLGAALQNRLFGSNPIVAVVFSASRYTKEQILTASVKEVTALRMSEELQASERAGYRANFLGFGEPFVRAGFSSFADIFNLSREEDDDLTQPGVRTAIQNLLATQSGGLTVAPLACGGHIDHRIVNHSVVSLSDSGNRLQIGFYEDLPYAAFLSESEILGRIPQIPGASLRPVLVTQGLEEKLDMLTLYDSQLGPREYEAVKAHWIRLGGERIWLPDTYKVSA